jgi:glycosyltransferase involved in cell wall biosynthesis
MPKVSLVIPAYNAEKHLCSVIQRIPPAAWQLIGTVWVVNDGSTDDTARVIEELVRSNRNIKAVTHARNRGYGQAVQSGLKAVQAEGPDYAVCLHADGQYPPESIPAFIQTAQRQNLDILQGSRLAPGTARQGGMPLYKFIAGKILVVLENRVFGLKLTDYHSGYLCYSRRAYSAIPFKALSSSFDFDLEVIAWARKAGMRIGEIPIPTRYADEVSYLNPVTYGLRVLKVMGKYIMGKY